MTNRVHAILRPRPFLIELVEISPIYFARIRIAFGAHKRSDAWAWWIQQPGDDATLLYVFSDESRN